MMDVLFSDNAREWSQVLERTARFDFFHTAKYHRIAERQGEGSARLLVFTEGDHLIALPVLVRLIGGGLGHGAHDITSVYGFAGPLASHHNVPECVLKEFRNSLTNTFCEMRAVSVFSRLHPLFEQRELVQGLGECVPNGFTVSIDLTLPPEVQLSKYRRCHLQGIRKLRQEGIICVRDTDRVYLDPFVTAYNETMQRVNAHNRYFFDRAYFEALLDDSGANAHLFVALYGGELTCGGLIVECGGMVHYLYSGTASAYHKLAPTKLLFDEVRLWAAAKGFSVLHLGGGVGGADDSLFHFKSGFSDRRHEFLTWRWVVDPAAYERLRAERCCMCPYNQCEDHARANEIPDLSDEILPVTHEEEPCLAATRYFPQYRCTGLRSPPD